jgi:hypothetical protein
MTWDTVDYRMESRSRSKNRQLGAIRRDPLRLHPEAAYNVRYSPESRHR